MIYSIVYDITARKQTEEALHESEERYKRITEGLTDYLYTVKFKDGKVIETIHGEACLAVTGYTSKEFAADPYLWINMIVPEEKESIAGRLLRLYKEKNLFSLEHRIIHKNGNIRWIHNTLIPFYDSNGQLLYYDGIIKDITERKQAEEILRVSEERFRSIFQHTASGMALVSLDYYFLHVNEAFCKMLGYTEPELIEKTFQDVTLPEDRQIGNELTSQLLSGKMDTFQLEKRYLHKNGTEVWGLVNSTLIRDIWNKPLHFVTQILDITERKQAELLLKEKNEAINVQNEEYQQLNEELIQKNNELIVAKEKAEESDRLKTAFLQNMSHEIRTPMNAIMGFSDLLVKNYDNKPKLEHFNEIINQSCIDLLEIINEILDIAKIESGQLPVHFEECNLNSMFTELSLFFQENKKHVGKQHIGLNIQATCDPSETTIITDKVKLKQIFINLINNAFKFTQKGKIEAGCNLNEKNNLIFYVSDTGIGIPEDKQNIIFERFTQLNFDSTRAYSGTGLGLAIVKGLINLLGGEIWLESEVNKGTTFYFIISYKKAENIIEEPKKIESHADYNFNDKKILVVEDDIYNAEYFKEIFANKGIKIVHTLYGKEAIEIALSNSFDLILMDIGLPDISGYEAIRKIKQNKPDIKIIAQTAYAGSDDKQKALDSGCIDYISKPLDNNLLLTMVKKHLSKG